VIDWTSGTSGRKSDGAADTPAAKGWQQEFVAHLGRSEAQRSPNAALRLTVQATHAVASFLSSLTQR
jgi:hypothetical protein